jgi:membrane protein DedA with SNARE-associated domain
MNKIKNFTKHKIWDYVGLLIWTAIAVFETIDIINEPTKISNHLWLILSVFVSVLYVRSIINRLKIKWKYEKTKRKLFEDEKI